MDRTNELVVFQSHRFLQHYQPFIVSFVSIQSSAKYRYSFFYFYTTFPLLSTNRLCQSIYVALQCDRSFSGSTTGYSIKTENRRVTVKVHLRRKTWTNHRTILTVVPVVKIRCCISSVTISQSICKFLNNAAAMQTIESSFTIHQHTPVYD